MSKKALIVIDIQNDYFPGGNWTVDGMEPATANAVRLLSGFRAAGDLVVHVRHENPTSEAPFFVAGTDGAKIHSDVQPSAGEAVIVKQQANSFRDTQLKQILDDAGIEELVICGAMSHMCVDAATRAAADYGYKCTVIHDACASRDLQFDGVEVPAQLAHAAFMAALGFGYANLASTASYLDAR